MPTRCPRCELGERTAENVVMETPLIIAGGLAGEWYGDTEIAKKHFASVKIAGSILSAPSMIVMSHFKGHGLAGFGGANDAEFEVKSQHPCGLKRVTTEPRSVRRRRNMVFLNPKTSGRRNVLAS
jgi:uncharacterized Fe-S center protein